MHFFLQVAQRIPRGKGRDTPIGSRKLLGRNISTFCEVGRPLPSTPSPGTRARQGSRAHRRQLSAWAAWPGGRFATSPPPLGYQHPRSVCVPPPPVPQHFRRRRSAGHLAPASCTWAVAAGGTSVPQPPAGFHAAPLCWAGAQLWEGLTEEGREGKGEGGTPALGAATC